ncbi:hypothetical protein Scep_013626 [Stephania cephalantha]|uniref:Uncharacterized protein n=1 Tax=Stephania cephalantha TaxID=152367 RepID=A0AAP0JHF1_9MAGN
MIIYCRDYVFTARQNNIGTNWPFPQHYLKLCLRHGVKELLPPFHPPPHSLTNRVVCGSHRPAVFDDVAALHHGGLDKGELIRRDNPTERQSCERLSSDQPQLLPPSDHHRQPDDHKLREEEVSIPSTVISHDEDCCDERDQLDVSYKISSCPPQEAPNKLLLHDVLDPADPPLAPQKNQKPVETTGKKLRLVLKLGSQSDPSRVDNITSSVTTISDPMASKVCPVCKTFSSTSNTTLNAHIDQCLSVESTSKWAIDAGKLTKHRVKPRKVMRSMTDIYLTAPCCTLEDLDRRNGSNWATDMALLNAAETNVPTQGKRKRTSFRTGLPDVEDEGAVYFDSNGTKVRILSGFCNPSIPTTGEVTRPKKHVKDGIQSVDKKIHLGPKHSANLKAKIQKKIPCCSLQDGTAILASAEAKHAMDTKQEKKESLSHLLKTRAQTSHVDAGTLRQWVCSKRTGILKKSNGKYNPRGLEYPLPVTRVPLVNSNRLALSNSLVEGGHLPKSHNLPEDAISSPNEEYVESVSYERQINGSCGQSSKSSENNRLNQLNNGGTLSSYSGYAMEPSSSLAKTSSYHRGKRKEAHADQIKRSDSLPKMTYRPSKISQLFSVGYKESTTLEDDLSAQQSYPRSKSNKSRKRSTLKKSRMHRSIAEMTELVKSPLLELDGRCSQMHDYIGNPSGCSNLAQRMGKFDCSSDSGNLETEIFVDELPFGGRRLDNFKEGGEDSGISEREEPSTLNSSYSGSEICGLDLASTDDSRAQLSSLQLQFSDGVTYKSDGLETDAILLQKDSASKKTFSKEAVGGTIRRCSRNLNSELRKPLIPSSVLPNSLQPIIEHERPVFGNEPLTRMNESPSSNQVAYATNVSKFFSNGVVELETDYRVDERNECEVAHTQVQVSSGSLPAESLNLVSSVDHLDRMSLASSKIPPFHDQHVVDRDGSGSPVSASSTISHTRIARAGSNYLAPDSSAKPPESQDQFVSGFSSSSSEPLAEKASIFSSADLIERMIFDTDHHGGTRLSTGEGAVKRSDAQFCCAQKDNNSLDAASAYQVQQIPGQFTMAMMQPAKEMHATFSPNNRPELDDKMNAPCTKTPDCPVTMKGPISPIRKPPINGGLVSSGLASQVHNIQSTSNPVLRLMGKNLMVLSNGEDTSGQITQPSSCVLNDYMDVRYSDLLEFSSGSTPSRDNSSICRSVPEGLSIYRQELCDPPLHCFNTSKGHNIIAQERMRHGINSETGERSAHPQASNYPNLNMEGFSMPSLMWHGFTGGFNFQAQERMPICRAGSSFAYDGKRVVSASPVQSLNSVSAAQASGGLMREVIVIDDTPDNEADSRKTYAEPSQMAREITQSSFTGNPAMVSNQRHMMSAFPCHMVSHSFSSRVLPGCSRSDFSIPCAGRGNASPLEWGDNSVLSAVKLQSPFTAQTPLTSHLCPTVYYSPSMS